MRGHPIPQSSSWIAVVSRDGRGVQSNSATVLGCAPRLKATYQHGNDATEAGNREYSQKSDVSMTVEGRHQQPKHQSSSELLKQQGRMSGDGC